MRFLFIVLFSALTLSSFAQQKDSIPSKKDSVQLLVMDMEQVQELIKRLDAKIDSKKETYEFYKFLEMFIRKFPAPPANKSKN